MAPFSIGFIGVGGIAWSHGKGMKARPDLFRLAAVADINPQGAKRFADEYGIPDRYDDFRKIIDDRKIDAVIVLLPHHLHEQVCIAAFAAGKHVLVEKPIARTLEETDRIIAAGQRSGKVLMVGHNQRFDPRHQQIRNMIDQGQFGKLFCARADHYQNFNPPAGSWWRSRDVVGGGCVIGSGIHRLDLLRWLMGDVEEVYAVLSYNPDRLEAEACAVATLRFRNGAMGEFICNWDVHRAPATETFGIWGEARSVTIGGWGPGEIGEASSSELLPLETPAIPSMWEHFCECIATGAEPLTSGSERAALELVLAVVKSGEIGKAVRLPIQ